jgi:hypothetical protein
MFIVRSRAAPDVTKKRDLRPSCGGEGEKRRNAIMKN